MEIGQQQTYMRDDARRQLKFRFSFECAASYTPVEQSKLSVPLSNSFIVRAQYDCCSHAAPGRCDSRRRVSRSAVVRRAVIGAIRRSAR